jgi:hypothetical protein
MIKGGTYQIIHHSQKSEKILQGYKIQEEEEEEEDR